MMVVHACGSIYLWGLDESISWTQEIKVAVNHDSATVFPAKWQSKTRLQKNIFFN